MAKWPRSWHPWLRALALFSGVGVAYALGSTIAFAWFNAKGIGPTFFPSAGLTVAMLVLLARRDWPAVLLGAAVAEVGIDAAHGFPIGLAVGYGLANVIEPLVAAELLRRWVDRVDLSRRRGLMAFLVAAVGLAPLAGAATGAVSQILFGRGVDLSGYIGQWWIGDGLGILVVGGAILAIAAPVDPPMPARRRLESAALLTATVMATVAVFEWHALPFAYMPAALLVLTSLRGGTLAAAIAGASMAFVAAQAAATEGPALARLGLGPSTILVFLQLWIMIVTVIGFLLAMEVAERERTALAWAAADTARRKAEADAAQAREINRLHEAEHRALGVAAQLRRVAADLGAAITLREVAEVIVRQGPRALGSTGGAVYALSEDEAVLSLVCADGDLPGAVEAEVPLDAATALSRALHERQPVVVDTAAGRIGAATAQAAVPLVAGGLAVGGLLLALPHGGSLRGEEGELLKALAEMSGQAVARARLHEREHRTIAHSEALRRIATELSATVSPDEAAAIISREGMASLGAASIGVILTDGDGAFRAIEGGGVVEQHARDEPALAAHGETISAHAIRYRQACFASTMDELAGRYPASAPVAGRLGLQAVAALPLFDHDQVIGVLSIAFAEPTRFDRPMRDFMDLLARDCEQALARTQLFAAERLGRRRADARRRLAEALLGSSTAGEVARTAARKIREALAAAHCRVVVRGVDGTPVVACDGAPADTAAEAALAAWGASASPPVFAASPAHLSLAEPVGPVLRGRGLAAAAVLHLRDDGAAVGAIAMCFTHQHPFDRDATEYIQLLVHDLEQALTRARLADAERAARAAAYREAAKSELLATVAHELSMVPTAEARMRRLLHLVVPTLADAAMVRAETGEYALSEMTPPVRELADRVVQTGAPHGLELPADDGQPARSAWAVPLRLGQRGLAVLTVQRDHPSVFTPGDRETLRAVAERAAISLENAHLYEHERQVSMELQQSLLGAAYPKLDGITIASYYGAGDSELQAGGDWHNVVSLPDGRIGFAAGDVIGHGLRAAVAMGQLRVALSALAPSCDSPRELLHRLDAFAGGIDGADMATVTYAVLDPADATLTYACAGHPPPLIMRPGQPPEFLWNGRSRPLQSVVAGPRLDGSASVVAGTVLLLYTDGLIERRGEPITEGLQRLATHAATLTDEAVPDLCQRLVEAMLVDTKRFDDVAVLAVRIDQGDAGRFTERIPNRTEALGSLRHELAAWLQRMGIGRADQADILIAVGEATANSIEHAYLDRAGEVVVDVRLTATGDLLATITDFGQWRPPRNDSDRGRGQSIMAALMSEVQVDTDADGSRVRLRRPVEQRVQT
jgi:serine/threonine-protein kinase RsbW